MDNFDLKKYLAEGRLNEVYVGENLSKILKLRSDLQNVNEHLRFLIKNDPDFDWQKFSGTTNSMLRAINKLI